MDLEEHLSELSKYYNREEYILLTAAQTQKDLSQFNMDFIIHSDTINFNTLLITLKPLIKELIKNDRAKLVQMFYRIDVAESKIGQALDLDDMDDSITQICEEILHRELKKVLIRKYYANK